ncbi:siderophore-interacting protein [Corynebacterium flavescens]|uniref:siderophore-interacting protein n=1 Tax=Corynebacterium flavescens TaxID=28028 RepID=UPI003FCF1A32
MGRGITGAVMKLLHAQDYRCEVVRTWMHSATMKAVRVSAPELCAQVDPQEGEYLRCWFADPQRGGKEAMRGYTVVDVDKQAGEFTLLFLLHEPAGPASHWAASAQVGAVFEASYYGSAPFMVPEPAPRGFVFIADAAGIPYVNALIEQLGEDYPLKVWLVEWHASDRDIELGNAPRLEVEWIQSTEAALLEHVKGFEWQGWFPHLICEAAILLPARRYLQKERGLGKKDMHVHAYWAQGKCMGKNRDA